MESQTKNKEIFDTEQNWKNMKVTIKHGSEFPEYRGIWIINDLKEDA